MMSKAYLFKQAQATGFKPEILEKVNVLLNTLNQFLTVPYIRERIALKGGTALNLFHFNDLPRMSVDIDINYIGKLDRAEMLTEKMIINDAIEKILTQNQYKSYRNTGQHAGGKMIWKYQSAFGQSGNLEIDLNYMYRQPLWEIEFKKTCFDSASDVLVPVLDIHELTAGKFSALFSRMASRDIFDAHYLLTKQSLKTNKLRLSFVVYIAMTDVPMSNIKIDSIDCDLSDMKNRLFPLLRQTDIPRKSVVIKKWAATLKDELCDALKMLLPLTNNEIDFINLARINGELRPDLITSDAAIMQKIKNHPALQWRMLRAG